jgi:hypothetical protein
MVDAENITQADAFFAELREQVASALIPLGK